MWSVWGPSYGPFSKIEGSLFEKAVHWAAVGGEGSLSLFVRTPPLTPSNDGRHSTQEKEVHRRISSDVFDAADEVRCVLPEPDSDVVSFFAQFFCWLVAKHSTSNCSVVLALARRHM